MFYRFLIVVMFGFFTAGAGYSQNDSGESIPDAVRRPQRGESPRFPSDFVIGALGRGQAPEPAYRFAMQFLTEKLEQEPVLRAIGARQVRLGGGREEPDGCISFLFRCIGREKSITGELYLRWIDNSWESDDFILEE
ncbi:hypothetical protein FACS1894172_00600 [Spirochaetia bacterium]|nr:hypothetical protein FACS1894164_07390 [Spirochaetia bacterium]GHU29450.1 hypothetical protein FACS1894172_00600 [Spirochaetia bacterium]